MRADRHDDPAALPPVGVLPGVSGLVPLAGAVARGTWDRTGAPVAVKVLPTPFDRDTRDQFDADRTRLGRLRHVPSILQIDDVDVLDDGRPYLVSELCADSVEALLDRGERLTGEEVAAVGSACAAALAAAHGAGVLHGRVAPANLLVRASGQPVLSDFGTAVRRPDPADSDEYVAPETLRDGSVTARSDLYGLGATLHAALTGRPPFPARVGEHPAERVLRVLRQAPPPVDPELAPPALATLLAELLATDPADRPADAARVAARFDALLAVRAGPADPAPPTDRTALLADLDAERTGGGPGARGIPADPGPAGRGGAERTGAGPAERGTPADPGPAGGGGAEPTGGGPGARGTPAGRGPGGPGKPVARPAADRGPGEPVGGSADPADLRPVGSPGEPVARSGEQADLAADGPGEPVARPADPVDHGADGPVWAELLEDDGDGEPERAARPPRRRFVLGAKVAAGVVLALVGVLLTRQIGSGPTLAAAPAAEPSPTAVGDVDPAETAVRLTQVRVVDRGRKVTLAWQGPPGMSYAVIVAIAGRPTPAARLVNQARTRTFVIEPGRQYCFQVQGSFDGVRAVQSPPAGINGATCEG